MCLCASAERARGRGMGAGRWRLVCADSAVCRWRSRHSLHASESSLRLMYLEAVGQKGELHGGRYTLIDYPGEEG